MFHFMVDLLHKPKNLIVLGQVFDFFMISCITFLVEKR